MPVKGSDDESEYHLYRFGHDEDEDDGEAEQSLRTGGTMKARTFRKPYAWAIIHGGKDIENRNWNTSYRGPLLIHAAKVLTRADYLDFGNALVEYKHFPKAPVPEQQELA